MLLSNLAPPEVVGWHAASMKLVGALVFPASSLITALYPTLFRLHAEDRDAYRETAAGALRTATVLVVPLALGCAVFPQLGVAIFGQGAFGPALDNLRVLAPYVFLVYFSMTLGCCLSAAGRRRAWVLLQFGCVGAAAALDVLLIPWFQARTGNGGLGVAASLLIGEVFVVAGAAWLAPAGLLGRRFAITALRAAAGGLAMVLAASWLGGLTPWIAAPVSVATYMSVLLLLGGPDVLRGIRELLGPRLARSRLPPQEPDTRSAAERSGKAGRSIGSPRAVSAPRGGVGSREAKYNQQFGGNCSEVLTLRPLWPGS